MKGLFVKELCVLKSSARTQLMTIALFIVLGLMIKSPAYLGMMITLLVTNMALSTMGYDESSSWNRFAMTMPVKRTDLITVKYFLLYLLAGISVVLSILLNIPLLFMTETSFLEIVLTSLACAGVAVLGMSLNVLLCTKFGMERARMMMVLSYVLPMGLVFLVYWFYTMGWIDFEHTTELQVSLFIGGIFVLIMALSCLFWKLSCRVFEKQDL